VLDAGEAERTTEISTCDIGHFLFHSTRIAATHAVGACSAEPGLLVAACRWRGDQILKVSSPGKVKSIVQSDYDEVAD